MFTFMLNLGKRDSNNGSELEIYEWGDVGVLELDDKLYGDNENQ